MSDDIVWTTRTSDLRSASQADFAALVDRLREAWVRERAAYLSDIADAAAKELAWLRNGAREAGGVSSPARRKAGERRRTNGVAAPAAASGPVPLSPRLRAGAYIGLLTKARWNGSPRAKAFARDLRGRWAAAKDDPNARDAVIADGRAAWATLFPGKTAALVRRRSAAQPRTLDPNGVAGRVRAYVAAHSAFTRQDVLALFRSPKAKHAAEQALSKLRAGRAILRTVPGHYRTATAKAK